MQWKKYITQLGPRLLVAALLLAGINSAQAVVNCKVSDAYPPVSTTVPLAGTFYIGNDLPVGSVIYQTLLKTTAYLGIYCDAAFSVDAEFRVTDEPKGQPSAIGGRQNVYPTNIPGIGVQIDSDGTFVSKTAPRILNGYFLLDHSGNFGRAGTRFSLLLIKTGNINSGGTVNGNSFPSVALNAVPTSGYSGLPINNIWTVNFSGSMTVNTSTCTTPGNPTFDLGTFRPEDFPSVGASTAWKDVSIQLTNCPVFTGYYGDGGSKQQSDDGATPSGGTLANNLLEMTIAPSTATAGDQQTFMLLDVADKASGVGYQIAHNPNEDMAPDEGGNNLYTSGDVLSQSMSLERSGSVSIPLRVRYKRTGVLRPGKMNGSFTVTINYK